MNKRIRKKKEQREIARAVNGLVLCYEEMVAEREKRCKELSEKYGVRVELDKANPLGMPIIFPLTEAQRRERQRQAEIRQFIAACEKLYERQQAQRG